MAKLTREQITNKIHCKFNKTIPKAVINDALGIILDELSESLANGDQLSTDNFGLLNVYLTHETSGVNISTGELEPIRPTLSVQFIPSEVFLELLGKKRDKFER